MVTSAAPCHNRSTVSATEIVGRQSELAALAAFLDDMAAGSSALRIEGPAGIGKTTLLRHTLHAAAERGFRVLACRPSEVEAQLSYAAVADLLGDAAEAALRALPRPQRRALSIALLRTESTGPPPAPTWGSRRNGGRRTRA